jgi:hypothetical protein
VFGALKNYSVSRLGSPASVTQSTGGPVTEVMTVITGTGHMYRHYVPSPRFNSCILEYKPLFGRCLSFDSLQLFLIPINLLI